MKTYRNDPKWLRARFQGRCHGKTCQNKIEKDARAWYYPSDRAIYCERCGDAMAREFACMAADESFIGG